MEAHAVEYSIEQIAWYFGLEQDEVVETLN